MSTRPIRPTPNPQATPSCCAYHRPTAVPMPEGERRTRLEAEAADLLRKLRRRGVVR